MYHRVLKEAAGRDWHAVSEGNFRKQLQLIDFLNYTPITFRDYQLYLEDQLTLPKKPVILTFDDGHLDTYEVAIPILRELDMRAVIFAVGNRDLKYAYWDQQDDSHEALPLMSDEQLLEARAEGFEIGAHTMNHPDLVKLSKHEQIREIAGSKKILEQLLGEEIISFAYPYGRVCKRSYGVARQAGFKFACGVYSGPPRFGDDVFDMRRLAVGAGTNLASFLLKLTTPYEYLEWLNFKLRHRPAGSNDIFEEFESPTVDYEGTLKKNLERSGSH